MNLKTEIIEEKQTALIISKINYPFIKIIKKKLLEKSVDFFFSPIKPKSYDQFTYIFSIDQSLDLQNISKKKLFVFIQFKKNFLLPKKPNIKIIKINQEDLNEEEVEKILWFSFSKSRENLLKLYSLERKKELKENKEKKVFLFYFNFKKIVFLIVLLIFIAHFIFLFPLIIVSYYSFISYQFFKKNDFSQIERLMNKQNFYLKTTENLYLKVKPTYLFFSINTYPDNLIEINKRINQLLINSLALKKISHKIFNLILKKNHSTEEKTVLKLNLVIFRSYINQIEKNLSLIVNNPIINYKPTKEIKKRALTYLELISQLKKIAPFLEEIFAKDTEKKYLLLFANNMELRPGGGFIGSFGILKFKNLTLDFLKIYDVYDADGQLKAHIEPPPPIRLYLNQPHWFLRDSAFSPDFFENYLEAKSFLLKEMGFEKFDGAILFTTTAIENILNAFGNIYLPDYKEIINSKNFYIKTQYYSEKNFFPGSTQKKNFLSSLTKQILINLENVSLNDLIYYLKKSLDEKQIVLYFEQPTDLQKIIDNNFWSGRIIEPNCLNKNENCISDYILAVDANLGVNKSNFFVNRYFHLKIYFDSQGKISHQLSISFKNESFLNNFLGGDYKNYFQLYLPENSTIKDISINGIKIEKEKIDEEIINEKIKKIGFFINIPQKMKTEIKINYYLNEKIKKGRVFYQLIVQKQIGSFNNDFILEFFLPKNYYLLNQNFIPLVKDNQIIYNTNLSTDKIFIIELIKD